MEHTKCTSPNIDKVLLEASLMYESANSSNPAVQYENYPKVPFCQPGNRRTVEREGKTHFNWSTVTLAHAVKVTPA